MTHFKYLLLVVVLSTFSQAARIWLPQSLTNDNYQPQTLEDPIDGLLVGLRRRLGSSLEQQQQNWRNKQRNNASLVLSKRLAGLNEVAPQISYVISPLSEQILPISSEKLSQGYRDFFPLADTYKLGLQRLSPANEDNLIELSVDQQLQQSSGGCRTLRSSIELERDELDKTSGRVLRTCKGLVQLNRCEGSCPSSVQPSIKSRSGFKKDCSCCNEAAFRRVQVRLSECTFPLTGGDQQVLMLADNGQANHENLPSLTMRNLAQEIKASGQLVPADSMMDIEVDEPIECKCRKCDSAL